MNRMNRFLDFSPSFWRRGHSRTASLAFTLVSMIAAAVLLFPTGARSQQAERTVYTTDNSGMPSNTVRALVIDAKGHIWIGTERGLAEFGSAKWSLHMSSEDVRALAVDAERNLWIGTESGLAELFGGESWQMYGLPNNRVRALTIAAEGETVWIGTEGGLAVEGKAPDTTSPRMILAPVAVSRTDDAVTVAWTTDEVSTSWVRYGLEAGYGLEAESDKYVTDHRVRLTGLMPDTTYHYGVRSVDRSGNIMLGVGDLMFRTRPTPDVLPPQILTGPVALSVDHRSAVIEWTTNELSDSRVEYGETTAYGYWEERDEDVRVHSVPLRHLTSSEEVHYRVYSTDPSGNEVVGEDRTFWTEEAPDTTAPEILTGPTVVAKAHDSATIVWSTDELSDNWVEYGETSTYGWV